jgi:alkylation response protein AidB-like acyl-CoA dehydrogenase
VRAALDGWTDGDRWERQGRLPAGVFAALGRAGVFRERWNAGRAPGLVTTALLAEELSLVSAGLGLGVCLHNEVFLGVLDPLARTDRQQAVRDAALAGDVIGCFASTEATGGSDVSGLRCRADRTDDGWHLKGEKRFTSNAGVASHAVVLAQVEGAGIAPFLVSLAGGGARVEGSYDTLGLRSCDTSQVALDVCLPDDALLGTPRLGIVHVQRALQMERLAATVQALTGASMALRFATAFARRRPLRGRTLISHGAARQHLASLTARLAAAEALLGATLVAAAAGVEVTRDIAMAKLVGARVANRVVDESLQLLGGRGYLTSFPLERWWRDVRLARIGGGTDEVMQDIIAGGIDRPDPVMDEWLDELEESEWTDSHRRTDR